MPQHKLTEKERVSHMKGYLENMAHKCNELSGRLSDSGMEISPEDKDLCRLAMKPAMDECVDMIQFYMFKGDTMNAERETDRMWDLYIR